eukprot:328576_1
MMKKLQLSIVLFGTVILTTYKFCLASEKVEVQLRFGTKKEFRNHCKPVEYSWYNPRFSTSNPQYRCEQETTVLDHDSTISVDVTVTVEQLTYSASNFEVKFGETELTEGPGIKNRVFTKSFTAGSLKAQQKLSVTFDNPFPVDDLDMSIEVSATCGSPSEDEKLGNSDELSDNVSKIQDEQKSEMDGPDNLKDATNALVRGFIRNQSALNEIPPQIPEDVQNLVTEFLYHPQVCLSDSGSFEVHRAPGNKAKIKIFDTTKSKKITAVVGYSDGNIMDSNSQTREPLYLPLKSSETGATRTDIPLYGDEYSIKLELYSNDWIHWRRDGAYFPPNVRPFNIRWVRGSLVLLSPLHKLLSDQHYTSSPILPAYQYYTASYHFANRRLKWKRIATLAGNEDSGLGVPRNSYPCDEEYFTPVYGLQTVQVHVWPNQASIPIDEGEFNKAVATKDIFAESTKLSEQDWRYSML